MSYGGIDFTFKGNNQKRRQTQPHPHGATLPLDGYGIVNLSLSENGETLLGQLKGGYSSRLYDFNQKPSQSHVWDVNALITAALAMSDTDRMSQHIVLPPLAEQLVANNTGPVAGTAFDANPERLNVTGNYGDIIGVDLKELLTLRNLASGATFDKFELLQATIDMLSKPVPDAKGQDYYAPMQLVLDSNDQSKPYSRTSVNSDAAGNGAIFSTEGVLFLAPQINKADLQMLRVGQTLQEKSVTFTFTYQVKINGKVQHKQGIVTVTAKDFGQVQTFFGDRPLDNQGYSKFALSGSVGVGSGNTNDVLDVYRVEQRLKYLGYTAFGTGSGNALVKGVRVPDEFTVDGNLGNKEQSALKALYAETHYKYNRSSGSNGIQTVTAAQAVVATGSETLSWLNAYNAPHWMNIYASFNIPYVTNQSNSYFTDGQNVKEVYATSWMHDLFSVWTQVNGAQGLTTGQLRINGLTDPTFALRGSGGHSVGMGIDLGVAAYINPSFQLSLLPTFPDGFVSGNTTTVNGWSIDNAKTGAGELVNAQGNRQRDALLNFLSLYALTQNTGTDPGTWSQLPVQNGELVRTALFGSGGANNTQLIQNVWIGGQGTFYDKQTGITWNQNPYDGMNNVLGQLGFSGQLNNPVLHHAALKDHYNHFHIDLRAPERVDLPQNLMTGDAASSQVAEDGLIVNAQTWLAQVKADLNLTQGEVTMWIPDMPNVPPQAAPVMIAQANQAQASDVKTMRTIGVCHPAPNNNYSGSNGVDPKGMAAQYLRNYEHRKIANSEPGTITILQQPAHGILRLVTEADRGTLFGSTASPLKPDAGLYAYLPEEGYLGKDKAIAIVEIGGVKVKVVFYFQAISEAIPDYDTLCKKGYSWKISSTLDVNGNSTLTSVEYQSPATDTATLAATLGSSVSSLFGTSGVMLNIADLAGGALGQTTGSSITLDTTAAGNNWFIDTTPSDNSEYLPTSNPFEWVAKAGSVVEAAAC